MSSDDFLIRAHSLGKCYQLYDKPHHRLLQTLFRGKRQFYREFWALQDVSLELRHGESLGILGRNGAGKSTLLQILSGVLTPTTGNVQVNGRVAALLELGSGFNPEFTGRENAYLNGSILGLTHEEMGRAMPEIERFAGVGDFFDQPVKLYSTGMLVRVAFSVQVQLKPDILIVDEALAVGDAIFQKRCYQRIRDLLETGVSLVFVTHDLEGVRLFTQKSILLEHGRIEASGESKTVLSVYQQKNLEEEKRYLAQYISDQLDVNASFEAAQALPVVEVTPTGADEVGASREREFGTFEARITKVDVLDKDDNPTNMIVSGDFLRIIVFFEVVSEINTLIVSVRIRNREGVKCYSWGTLSQDMVRMPKGAENDAGCIWGKTFEAGQSYSVVFETRSCDLGGGFYEVEAQLTRRAKLGATAPETVVHWLEEASFFSVRIDYENNFFGGVCDLHMQAGLSDARTDEN